MGPSSPVNGDPTGARRWQGARWRRLSRGLTGSVVLVAVAYSWLSDSPSGSQVAVGLPVVALVLALSEWLFARRMGFEIGADGVTLRGAVSQVFIPWSRVRGVRWEQARRLVSKTEHLYIDADHPEPRRVPADASIRIPTVACATRSSLPNDRLLGPLLSSPKVRAADGTEADAMEVLEGAWSADRSARRG